MRKVQHLPFSFSFTRGFLGTKSPTPAIFPPFELLVKFGGRLQGISGMNEIALYSHIFDKF